MTFQPILLSGRMTVYVTGPGEILKNGTRRTLSHKENVWC